MVLVAFGCGDDGSTSASGVEEGGADSAVSLSDPSTSTMTATGTESSTQTGTGTTTDGTGTGSSTGEPTSGTKGETGTTGGADCCDPSRMPECVNAQCCAGGEWTCDPVCDAPGEVCENPVCCDPNGEPQCIEGSTCCTDGKWECNEGPNLPPPCEEGMICG